MRINLLKKKNKKIDKVLTIKEEQKESNYDEKQELIKEIGEEIILDFCNSSAILKEDISIYLLRILKDNPNLIEKLKYLDLQLIKKINNNTLTLEDIPPYNLDLLSLPIFNEKEQKRLNLLTKNINLTNNNYRVIKSNTLINEVTTTKEEEQINSYIDNIELTITKHVLPIVKSSFINLNGKYNYIFDCDNYSYYKETKLEFDNNTIIVTSYNDFLNITKENTDKLSKYKFVLKEDYKLVNNLETTLFLSTNSKENNYTNLKLNHLLYLINNSSLEDNRKNYYDYHLKEEIPKINDNFYFYNYNFNMLINKLVNELGYDFIKEKTEEFNNLAFELQNKDIIKEKYSINIFLEDIKDIDNIKALELVKKISFLDKEKKEIVLSDEKIKSKLRKGLLEESINDQYKYYRDLMKYFNSKEVLDLFDADYLNEFFKNQENGQEYKLFVCLCENDINETIKNILKDDKMFEEFFKNNDYFYSMFYNLDYELLRQTIFKMENNNLNYSFSFICSVKEDDQIRLLNENISNETIIKIVPMLRPNVLTNFFKNNIRAREIYQKFNVTSLAEKGTVFSDDILKSKKFFDLLKSTSFIEFRNNINTIEQTNQPIFIEERLKDYYDELINSYNKETGLFKEYDNILNTPLSIKRYNKFDFILSGELYYNLHRIIKNNKELIVETEIKEILKNETSKKLSEIIIDAIFQDNIYNVYLNIDEMIRYNSKLEDKEKVLDKDKLEFYKFILNFDNIDNNEKVEFYEKMKNKNFNLVFYDDLRKLKDLSYENINKEMLKPQEHKEYKDEEKTNKYGIDIYDLKDKEYTILVRMQSRFYEKTKLVRNCYSLISNQNSSIYGGENIYQGFLYGYNTLDRKRVLHILESDSFSSSQKEDSTRFVNRIMSAEEIVNSNFSYSEIQIINKKIDDFNFEAKKPDFLVVYDNIKESEVEEAKRLNIPIVIITPKHLDKENKINIYFNSDIHTYVNSTFYEQKKKNTR